MSTPGPAGRSTPRWSVDGAPALDPASSAGLLVPSAWVGANPPLSCSGPRLGLTVVRSDAATPEISFVEPMRLWPWLVIEPNPSEGVEFVVAVLPAKNVQLTTSTVPVSIARPPPNALPPGRGTSGLHALPPKTSLLENVQFVSATNPL